MAKKKERSFFNFKRLMGTDVITSFGKEAKDSAKKVFTPDDTERKETFEEAVERLGMTEKDISDRKRNMLQTALVFAGISLLIFCYTVYLLLNGHVGAGFLGLCVMLMALMMGFRYHFWYFQMKKRKLGCTIKEWFHG